jgi:hypothetical protein
MDSELVAQGILERAYLSRLLHENTLPARNEKLFTLLVLELWYRIFITRSLLFDSDSN